LACGLLCGWRRRGNRISMRPAVVALGLLVYAQSVGASDRSRVFESPDRRCRAVVVTGATGESLVEIQTISRHVLFSRDERSEDGSHGQGIVQAAWTSDSQFFVASTSATGGQQPWARPLWVYSRARNQVFELSRLGITATNDFTLKPPDIVRTTVLGCDAENIPRNIAFSLHQLVSTDGVPAAPCPN
jgi:hypothetical protein